MHILLTNDDGPPHPSHSPYISTLISVLTSPPFSHTVSVVLPSQQRSWIGKAHLLPASTYQEPNKPIPQPHSDGNGASNANREGGEGLLYSSQKNDAVDDLIRPTYLDPTTGKVYPRPQDISSNTNSNSNPNQPPYYVLIPGTPATCTQLGLFHHSALFPPSSSSSSSIPPTLPPIDLLLSGPNHGRNTTAAFALSSGTLGGALEAAIAGTKAIALSFAFFTRKEPQELVREACVLSARIIEALMADWSGPGGRKEGRAEEQEVQVYSINVPLVEGIGAKEVKWTWMLGNTWTGGRGLYAQTSSEQKQQTAAPPTFKWSPSFGNIWTTIDASAEGNDGKVVKEGFVSVTPLMANFMGVRGFSGVMKL